MKVEIKKSAIELVVTLTEDEAYKLKAILGGFISPGPYKVDSLERLYEEIDDALPQTKYEFIRQEGKQRGPFLKPVEDDE